MAIRRINITAYLSAPNPLPLLDVRTPAEFEKGHIPGAKNLPLFSDNERVEVGTLYKQVDPRAAFLKGLEFVGPKMRSLVEQTEALTDGKQVAVHCWRGGQRSNSLGWLLDMAGFDVVVLEGGYKAYRNHILDYLKEIDLPFLVLGGKTGARKTEILHQIAKMGEQVLDLEGLANHKGSAFGALGLEPQPSVEHFDNMLFEKLSDFDPERRIWVENESKSIGRVYLAAGVWNRMQEVPMIELDMPLEERVAHLVDIYGGFSHAVLEEAFMKIKKRLGGQHLNTAIQALAENDLAGAARVALKYYDKAYVYHRQNKRTDNAGRIISFTPKQYATEQIAEELVAYASKNNL